MTGEDDFVGGEELPEDFEPSKYDVIVGWARQYYQHEGNQTLRGIVRKNVPRYMAAKTKHEKGQIIVEILQTIKAKSPSGMGLLRQNSETKRWFYIGTDKAKDKIGHALRKASRDLERGVKGSPVKQKQNRRNGQTGEVVANTKPSAPIMSRTPRHGELPSPRSACSSGSSMALKSFQTGPSIDISGTDSVSTETVPISNPSSRSKPSLEMWPLRSVTSLSSSESHCEDLIQNHQQRQKSNRHHHTPHLHQPVQVTLPSSPVTRPSNSGAGQDPAEGNHYHPQSHHGHLTSAVHQHDEPAGFNPHGSNYRRRHHDNPPTHLMPQVPQPYPQQSQQSHYRGHNGRGNEADEFHYYSSYFSACPKQHSSYHNGRITVHYRSEEPNMNLQTIEELGNHSGNDGVSGKQCYPPPLHGHHDYSSAFYAPQRNVPIPSMEGEGLHRIFDEVEERQQQERAYQGNHHQYPQYQGVVGVGGGESLETTPFAFANCEL